MQESNKIKTEANGLFSSGSFRDALAKYDEAVESCPKYLHYERAVLQSNIAACHLQLEDWKDAIKAATESLESLTTLEKRPVTEKADDKEDAIDDVAAQTEAAENVDAKEKSVEDLAAKPREGAPKTPAQHLSEDRQKDVLRIRTKALLRRARGRAEAGGWQNLAGAEEDYKTLSKMPGLTPADIRTVKTQLRLLPPKVKAAQEKETAEMWGKLKQLGDGILKPFGLSTNNFQMVKDESSGGYSMNFSQGGPSQ